MLQSDPAAACIAQSLAEPPVPFSKASFPFVPGQSGKMDLA